MVFLDEAVFVRCYFPEWSNTIKRLPSKKYPTNPQTIGDHLLKRRLDLHLLQKDVAQQLGVTTDCITLWENGNSVPQIQHVPKIIAFLGSNPYMVKSKSLGGRIKNYRLLHGLSHKKLGKILGVDASTVGSWENGKFIPEQPTINRLEELLSK